MGHTQGKCSDVEECDGPRQTTDAMEQSIVMDSRFARTSENIVTDSGIARADSIVMGSKIARASEDKAGQTVMSMDQEEGISKKEQTRRRLRSKQSAQQTLTDDVNSLETTETRGDNCYDPTRGSQNCE